MKRENKLTNKIITHLMIFNIVIIVAFGIFIKNHLIIKEDNKIKSDLEKEYKIINQFRGNINSIKDYQKVLSQIDEIDKRSSFYIYNSKGNQIYPIGSSIDSKIEIYKKIPERDKLLNLDYIAIERSLIGLNWEENKIVQKLYLKSYKDNLSKTLKNDVFMIIVLIIINTVFMIILAKSEVILPIINLRKFIRDPKNKFKSYQCSKEINDIYRDFELIINKEKLINEELSKSKQMADNLNQNKVDFLHNLSHSIKTPLNSILGFTEILKNREKNLSDEYKAIIDGANDISRIINQVEFLTKYETNNIEILEHKFLSSDLINALIKDFKNRIKDNKLKIYFSFDKNLPKYLIGDIEKIKLIILELFNNALSHTEKGFIKIELSHVKDRLKIDVSDSGVGIPHYILENIFNPASKLTGEYSRSQQGIKLGLLIAKYLANLMTGDVVAKSQEGKGSIFSVHLKAMVDMTDGGAVAIDPIKDLNLEYENQFRILVADDVDDNRLLIDKFLEGTDSKVDYAENGKIALDKLKNEIYDLLLLDIQMPVMDGFKLLERVHWVNYQFKIVAITASTISDMEKNALFDNCETIINKPVNRNKLIKFIKKMVEENERIYRIQII